MTSPSLTKPTSLPSPFTTGRLRGLTIVGLRLFLNERGLAKIVIGLARGRKSYDKREYLKENDARREMDKAMKAYKR